MKETKQRQYYKTRLEAETNRKSGEKMYHKAGKGFYLLKMKKKTFWEEFFGL